MVDSKTAGLLKSIPLALILIVAGLVCIILNFSLLPVLGMILGVICIAAGIVILVKSKKAEKMKQTA